MSVTFLNDGVSALLASQAAMQTAGNNIANVNTPGYSRQTAVLQQAPTQFTGSGYVGQGVSVNTVMRNYNAFLTTQANQTAAQAASASTLSAQLTQMETVFASGSGDLGSAVSNLFNSFSSVVSAPTDPTARGAVISNATQMAAQFNSSAASLATMQSSAQTQLQESVTAINNLASQIAAVNVQIAATTGTGQPPNAMLDQRDQLIAQLNQYVQTTSIPAANGTVSIFLASSQPLVNGTTSNPLSLVPGTFPGDTSTSTLQINQSGLSMPLNQSNLGGGSVNGLMTFLNQSLPNAYNLLGRMALAVGTVTNNQQQLGLDQNGNPGANLFQLGALPNGLPAASNAGTGSVSMSVSNPAALAVSNYQLTYTSGTAGTITRLSDGTTTAFDFASPPVQVDGLTLSATPGAVAGDSFLLKPFATAAAQISTALSAPSAVAAASPIQASAGSSNTGGLSVTSMQAQTVNANLTDTVNLTFNAAAGTFDAVDATTATTLATGVPYTPGQPISYNGWALTLSGQPQTGDTITVGAANPAYLATNSGNATALMNLRDLPLFDGAALTNGYAAAIAQVGLEAQSASTSATSSQAAASSAKTAQANVSGVNLDEEAANLLQYQQAYQASAKMIQISQSIFDSVISAMG